MDWLDHSFKMEGLGVPSEVAVLLVYNAFALLINGNVCNNNNYSKLPKSEHVRISDRGSLFGCNFCSVLNLSEIQTNLFGFQTFGWLTMHVRTFRFRRYWHSYAINPEIRTKLAFKLVRMSERLKSEYLIVRISALSEIRMFRFRTLNVLLLYYEKDR